MDAEWDRKVYNFSNFVVNLIEKYDGSGDLIVQVRSFFDDKNNREMFVKQILPSIINGSTGIKSGVNVLRKHFNSSTEERIESIKSIKSKIHEIRMIVDDIDDQMNEEEIKKDLYIASAYITLFTEPYKNKLL